MLSVGPEDVQRYWSGQTLLLISSKYQFRSTYNFPSLCLPTRNKLASLEAALVQNSADPVNDRLTGVKCRATGVAKKQAKKQAKNQGEKKKNITS